MVKGQTMLSTRILAAAGAVILLQWVVLMAPSSVFATTSSTLLKITEVYPDAEGSSELGKEFIEVANTGATPIDLSQYQLQIKDSTTKRMQLQGSLTAGIHQAFITSFSLVNSGDVIQLVLITDTQPVVVEEVTYTKTLDDTWSWSYFPHGWEQAVPSPGAASQQFVDEQEVVDVCPATPEIDTVIPEGYVVNNQGECTLIPETASCNVEVTEISAQTNYQGNEYIEFFNPSGEEQLLEGCGVQINGRAPRHLPAVRLASNNYYVWELANGTISNGGGSVILQRDGAETRQYQYINTGVGRVVNYQIGKNEGVVSNIPTPGTANQQSTSAEEVLTDAETSQLSDCGAGKYRSPETNRCRTIEVATSLTPCAADQERNPETNRCRKVATTASTLTPCKAGQERNPETNRCRQVATTASDLKPCAEGQERNPETNRCRKVAANGNLGSPLDGAQEGSTSSGSSKYTPLVVAALAVGCLGYGLYEYRSELRNMLQKIKWLPKFGGTPD
jgi:hypothetical protein